MPQRTRTRYIKITIAILTLLMVAGVVAQLYFTHQVKEMLGKEIPQELHLSYDQLSTNVLLGKITLTEVSWKNSKENIAVQAASVSISGLQYIPLLQHGDIIVSNAEMTSPSITVHKKEKDTTSKKDKNGPSKSISINNFQIHNGSFKLLEAPSDSIITLQQIEFTLSDIHFDQETAAEKIPFTYGDYSFQTKNGYYDLGPLEHIKFEQLQLSPDDGEISGFTLQTKYSKDELSKRLAFEHDHYDLSVQKISLNQWNYGIEGNLPFFHLEKLQLQSPSFHVYRDKLLPDDVSHKKIYNQALRDLKMDLQVDSITISKGLITYEERLEADVAPENLSFTQIDATINNLHTLGNGNITIAADAKLMDNGQLEFEWEFDPQSKSNDFLAKGSLTNFESESITPFLKTNLNAEVSGTIQQMYFTISGNELESQGDMKMKYDNFEFTVLKKDRLGVNKLLTAVVNLFTKDGNKTDDDGFRHGDFKVERRQDKSFFNYLWINLKEGLVHTMTGRGKKRD
ncbi:DUF748 domain-containing protein [Flagellimonas okinawensis]|uniref:DUF748 domain-containing protein n=1 Tax=Flagellimonas okinawensis TaxID=3031324 RepID=A0ABT5XT82_9FLAO|nr:DUF748 domain-containing protein [[Muricauda] okinawensis]MDF0709111.1 DUF748 domain-containing protein [[Muricauda] okinawensis]